MALLPTTSLHVGARRHSVPDPFGLMIAISWWLRPRPSLVVLILSCCIFGILMYGAVRVGDICPDNGSQPCWWYELSDSFESLHRKLRPTFEEGADKQAFGACKGFPDTSNILLVMKTGASESWSKIPTQLNTNLRCKDDFLIFSDMMQTINGVHIHDSLDAVLPKVSKDSQDFELYRRQKLCPIDQDSCNRDFRTAEQGWNLDKYKNIHIAEKAYAFQPGFDWYMFVDADSYVVWPTLVEWLSRIDPQRKIYMGSVAMLGDMPFAHGGSGYLVSRSLMEDMFDGKTGVANRYDVAATQTCCGDALFSHAVQNETGVEVVNVVSARSKV